MKNGEQGEIDNPAELTVEDLLRFLEAGPQIVRERARLGRGETTEPACPAAEEFLSLATGELAPERATELRGHAAVCAACAEALEASGRVLEGNPSPEEAAAIGEMAAARLDWQQGLARELAGTASRRRPLLPFRVGRRAWIAGSAGLAAALVLGAGVLLWQRERAPERQLARAYEQSRMLELRIPDAGFAEFREGAHTRGGPGDREPAPLLEARARLARELERSPQNGRWLELEARADLLEERYDAAIDVLERLIAEGPVTPELLGDAAAAYYQRGLVTGSEADRSMALDDLARADKLAPTDPVILFNEAIVMEDRGQTMNAVEVWNRYITVERDQKWRDEGKRKLAELERTLNRLQGHQSRLGGMPATPAAMDAMADRFRGFRAADGCVLCRAG